MRSGGKLEPKFYAHRVAWELAAGPIPDWANVLHTCDRPICIRNDEPGFYEVNGILRPRQGHLWLGTTDDNSADKWAKGRGRSGDTHPWRINPALVRHRDGHPGAKLTSAQVAEIRTRKGERHRLIAVDYGVSAAAISLILSERRWATGA